MRGMLTVVESIMIINRSCQTQHFLYLADNGSSWDTQAYIELLDQAESSERGTPGLPWASKDDNVSETG